MCRAEGHGHEHGCVCVYVQHGKYLLFFFTQKNAGQNFYLGIIHCQPFLFLFLSYGIKGGISFFCSSPYLTVEENSTSLLGLANLKLHLRADKDRAETAAHDRPSVQ